MSNNQLNDARITVRFDQDTLEKIKKFSIEDRRSASNFIRKIMEEYVITHSEYSKSHPQHEAYREFLDGLTEVEKSALRKLGKAAEFQKAKKKAS